jgi:hypothetical protein
MTTPMVPTSDLTTSATASMKSLVSVDKDGRIEVLDATVLDLIAGGLAATVDALLADDNGNCNC